MFYEKYKDLFLGDNVSLQNPKKKQSQSHTPNNPTKLED
jgi:hypothetical protein